MGRIADTLKHEHRLSEARHCATVVARACNMNVVVGLVCNETANLSDERCLFQSVMGRGGDTFGGFFVPQERHYTIFLQPTGRRTAYIFILFSAEESDQA